MSILLVTDVFPPAIGGSGRWLWEIYRRLPRSRVVVVAGEDLRQEAFDRTHDLRIVRASLAHPSWGLLHFGTLRRQFRLVRRLRALIRSERISTVHAGKCLPEGLTALGLKVLSGTHYMVYVHGEELKISMGSRELAWLSRRVLSGAMYLVANSANTARILREDWGVPAANVVVIHPGVDSGRFAPCARSPEVRADLGWGDRPVILTVGRLQKRKGHDRMIEAVTAIRTSLPGILYAVLGDGEERPALQALVSRMGLDDHVQFLGERDETTLLRAYQQCDLFILPNRQAGHDIEGFGMVLVEAQSCGKPVVAGASGGTAETLKDAETGLVVDCEDPARIAAAVLEILTDRERLSSMGEAARRWAVATFDWSRLLPRAEQLFALEGRP
jgi:phosphatidyl-myo-inositol dimannoside synthase